jgi:sialic acid synthase SpsE
MSVFIIAEAGSCHDGVYDRATDLIRAAKDTGADAVKFQYWSSAKRLAERRNAPTYLPIYEKYAMPYGWIPKLWNECEKVGLEFMCTAYLPEDIGIVASYVKRFKIASFEADDKAFIEAHRGYNLPIIISTGMGATPPYDTFQLHCVSAYPTPFDQANLALLYRGQHQGYSDHTCCVHTGGFATAAGAKILEVHFRNWTTARDNPDYMTALDPGQLTEYVRLVRLAEKMLGDGERRVQPAEAAMSAYKVRA